MYKTTEDNFIKILSCIRPDQLFIYVPPFVNINTKALIDLNYGVYDCKKYNEKIIQKNLSRVIVTGFSPYAENPEKIYELFGACEPSIVYYFPNNKKKLLENIKLDSSNSDDFIKTEEFAKIKSTKNHSRFTIMLYEKQKKVYEELCQRFNIMTVLV